ncbi:MAG: alpha/beta hydrolase family protein [Termitinemataceae bacterium]|nr:MAG: alpha/beta hydrolase family protein [Termitinemataceae bacterium]
MKKNFFGLILFLTVNALCFAANVQTVGVPSASMSKDVQTLIVSPNSGSGPASVIYLLHGFGGDQNTWADISPELGFWADHFNLIFVCPDGKNFWWMDSPIDETIRYETFVVDELVQYVDSKFNTLKDNSKRAISGCDTGGNSALYIAMKHPDVFKNAGSSSGVLDIFNVKWIPLDISRKKDLGLSLILGSKIKYKASWVEHSMLSQVKAIKTADIRIIIDCGIDDEVSFRHTDDFHKQLATKKIPHTFVAGSGIHDKQYWRSSISYQILFFVNHFNNVSE